jgi:hypothetical protein
VEGRGVTERADVVRRVKRQAARLEDAKAARDEALRDAYATGTVSLAHLAEAAGLSKARVGQIVGVRTAARRKSV